jgi:uroporphyrinogen III methyltransferase/synthase
MPSPRGSLVSFVSLGPGDPGLRTARAVARLAEADVVVTDEESAALSNPANHLVTLAREGKHVARAMSGALTESVSGLREAIAVAQAGVKFEIVPGIGARASAAAFAGLVGSAWRVRVTDIGQYLSGEAPDAIVTLVSGIGEPHQRVVVTTAAEASQRARSLIRENGGNDEDELTLSQGQPHPSLRWFERLPLFGKRVLVTRAAEQAESAAALLREAGAEPVLVPTITIGAPDDPAPLAKAVAELRAGAYAWVAFTSANGVERTWSAITEAKGDARVFAGARLAAIGPATAAALERHGLHADVLAQEFKGEGLASEMLSTMRMLGTAGSGAGRKVLIARASQARDVLPEALRAAGWAVDVVAAYQTRPPDRATLNGLVSDLEAGTIDVVTFTSSSTVTNLCNLLGPIATRLLSHPIIASIGPITTETARSRGLRVDVTAAEYTLPGLVRALSQSPRLDS